MSDRPNIAVKRKYSGAAAGNLARWCAIGQIPAGMMRRTMLLAAVAVIQLAQIEPIHLVCRGDLRASGSGPSKRDVLSVTIDVGAGIVTIDGYAPVPITSSAGDDTVSFLPKSKVESGVTLGFFTRLNREISVHLLSPRGTLRVFRGNCRRAERL
jgi:hypothetical protein